MEGAMAMGKIEQFTGKNYLVWSMKMAAILRNKKLFKEVIETPIPDECTDQKNEMFCVRNKWEEKNNEAFSVIIVTLADDQAGMFIGETSARKVWEDLKEMYKGDNQDQLIDINIEIKNIKMGRNEMVDSYITRVKNLIAKLHSLGGKISEREIVFHTVRGIDDKLESIATVLRARRSATINEVHQCLKEEEKRLLIKRGTVRNNDYNGERAYRSKENTNRNYGRNSNDILRKCFICGKPNHIAKDCWHRKDVTYQTDKRTNNKDKNKVKRKDSARLADGKIEENAFGVGINSSLCDRHKYKNDTVIEWNLDSGCTSHMTYQRECLNNLKEYSSDINLAEKGRKIQATAKGQIRMSTMVGNDEKIIKMDNVLLVPKLKSNLLSVKGLVENGNSVIFDEDGAKIYNKKGSLVANGEDRENMYIVEAKLLKDENTYVTKSDEGHSVISVKENVLINERGKQGEKIENRIELWHKRLGHLNERYLKKMKDEYVVRGLTWKGNFNLNCESCILGKSVQKPFKLVIRKQTSEPLQLVHMDLCGPLPVRSLGGNQYIYVIVDDFSKKVFVNLLKEKTETFKKFVGFKNKSENELDKSIKRVRSDNGTEFVNKDFQKLFDDEGIKAERTVPYSPSSNGVAEKMNRTLLDMARTMLIDAGLPSYFWGEAIKTAAYIKNRVYREKGEGKCPIEQWSSYKPTVEYMKAFGCVAYYFVPKQQRNKLSARMKKGIFVGYSEYRKAYRIYSPETRKVYECRNAKFNEQKWGYILLDEDMEDDEGSDELQYINIEIENSEDKYGTEILLEDRIGIHNEDIETEVNEGENEGSPNETADDDMTDLKENTNKDNVQDEIIEATRGKSRPIGSVTRINMEDGRRQDIEREGRLQEQGVRRSVRIRQKNEANVTDERENKRVPKTFDEARESQNSQKWERAMKEELQSLEEHEVWDIIEQEKGMKILPSKWVYNIKRGSDGNKDRFKARLVVMGNTQKKGVDYRESYSPVLKVESLRIMMAIAAKESLIVKRYDVKTAYLYGELEEEVYMRSPRGYKKGDGKVLHLKKSLYGLPQSGRNWNVKLNQALIEAGLSRIAADPCLYTRREKGEYIILGIYVDDGIMIGTSERMINEIMDKVKSEFEIREEDGTGEFLGIEIEERKEGIYLSQEKQIEKLLLKYGMENCHPLKTPVDINQDIDGSENSKAVNVNEYQEIIGSLMYVSVGTRPDITYGVNRLAQFCKKPQEIHMTAAKRIIKYLKGTKGYKLWYDRKEGKLEGCSDASWNNTVDAKSHSGYLTRIGNCMIGWKTKKQELVALSTCEAEVAAMCEVVKEIHWTVNVLEQLKMVKYLDKPTKITSDSQAGIDWSKGQCVKQRTKHFNRKYYYVRDEIEKGEIEVSYVNTKQLEADVLTKGVSQAKIEGCIKKMNLGTMNISQ